GSRNIPVSAVSFAVRRVKEIALDPIAILTWPARVAFDPAAYGHQVPYSPFFPLVVLLALAGAIWERSLRGAVIFCGLFFLVAGGQDPRFLFPIVALLGGVAAAALYGALSDRWRRSALAALAGALLFALPGIGYAVYRVSRQGLPPTDRGARERYL